MNKMIVTILTGLMLVLSPTVWSHTDMYLDTVKALHGGQLRMAGPYHLELVAKDKEIALYVTDHADNEINTSGGLGKATIQIDNANISIKLEPAGENSLTGTGTFLVKPETVIVVFIKLPEQEAQAARFAPFKPRASAVSAQTQENGALIGDHHH